LREKNEQPEGTELGAAMDQYYFEASKAMGYEFDEEEFNTEFSRRVNALSKFGKVKFIGRLIRTLSKANKAKEQERGQEQEPEPLS
ncbi:MAG: hypothetical protein IJ131_06710, partial [Eggerthellaceae bacterium]|nr:hypothetical protein [Eggerthellaceae bacterium]